MPSPVNAYCRKIFSFTCTYAPKTEKNIFCTSWDTVLQPRLGHCGQACFQSSQRQFAKSWCNLMCSPHGICKHILRMRIICKNGTPYLQYSTKCTNINVFRKQYCTSCIAFFLQSIIGMSQLLCSGRHPARVCYPHLTYLYLAYLHVTHMFTSSMTVKAQPTAFGKS